MSSTTNILQTHRTYLRKFRTFDPADRKTVYLQSMSLPVNYRHFSQILQSEFTQFLTDHTLEKDISEIVTALAHYYPQLRIQWLPGIVYPFVKLIKKDSLAQFEVSLTYLVNWCCCWFKDYPSPAIDVINYIASQLPELNQLVVQTGNSLAVLIWPSFLVSFTDVLNKEQWLQLFDYLVVRPEEPWLLLASIVQLLRILHPQIKQCETITQMVGTIKKQRKIDIQALIRAGIKRAQQTQQSLKQLYSNRLFPLPKNQYPPFQFINKSAQLRYMFSEHRQENLQELQRQVGQLQATVNSRQSAARHVGVKNMTRYSEKVESGLREQLKNMAETHQKKLAALRNTEENLKDWLTKNQRQVQIEADSYGQFLRKRAILEQAMQNMRREAETIKQMETQGLNKLRGVLQAKKDEQQLKQKIMAEQVLRLHRK